MILKRLWSNAKSHPYAFLVVFGIVTRLAIHFLYNGHVSIFNDSDNYRELAAMLKSLDFSNYNGGRTPGYPFLILLANLSVPLTVFYQSLLGILTSLMLYGIFLKTSRNTSFSLLAGLVPSIFMHFLFYERAILTETFTVFWLVLCIWFMVQKNFFNQPQKLANVILIGVIAMVTVTVRPMFLILPLFISIYYVFIYYSKGFFHNFIRVVFFCIPFVLFYSFWTSFNEKHTGYKSITSYSGINLAQNTVFFVEKADDEFSEIRDVHARKRDSLIANEQDPAMAIWFVYNELKKDNSLTPAAFSERLNPMNTRLIKENKWAYLRQVSHSWINFWDTNLLWNYESFKHKYIARALAGFWLFILAPIIILIKAFFLFLCGYHFFIRIKKRKWIFNFELFCVLLILGASVGQALVTFGSNARFSMPFFPLIVIVVLQFFLNINKKICHNQS